MPDTYGYVKIDKSNAADFERFIPDLPQDSAKNRILDPGDYGIGITKDEVPCGAVILHRNRSTLVIRSIRTDNHDNIGPKAGFFDAIFSFAKNSRFSRVECKYADDEPNLTEDTLRKAGFTEFIRDSVVMRVDAYTLGSLLRDGPLAGIMFKRCVRLINEQRVISFTKASPEALERFKELYPDDRLSFMTIDGSGNPESHIVVSGLPDGSLYLSDMSCPKGREKDLEALMYMCFGQVFMRTEPDGDFYIAGISDSYRKLAELFFEPLKDFVESQCIMTAVKTV